MKPDKVQLVAFTVMGDMGQCGTHLEGVFSDSADALRRCVRLSRHGHCDRYFVERRDMLGGPGEEVFSVVSDESKRSDAEHEAWVDRWNRTTTMDERVALVDKIRPPQPFPAHLGMRWEAAKEEPDHWKFGPSKAKCRSLKCPNRVAAWLFRKGKKRSGWWGYCAEHLYGRWIEDGKVWRWRLVPDA